MHVTVVIHVELVPTLVFGAIRMHIAAAKSAAGRPSLRQLATVQPKLDFTSAQLVSTRVRHQLPTQKLNAPYPPPAQTDGPSAPQSEPAAKSAAGRPSLRQLATVQPKLDFSSAQLVSTRVRHQLGR